MPDAALSRWRALVAERARREGRDLPLDVIDELATHLADHEASAIQRGVLPEDARQSALNALDGASFGDVAQRTRSKREHTGDRVPVLLRDVAFAVRQLSRSPGFTATALLTLAIGIGANTAVFTLVHSVLLASLPVEHAGDLYKLGDEYRCCPQETLQGNWSIFSYPFYRDIRDGIPGFEDVAAMQTLRTALSVRHGGAGAAEPFTGEFVSGNYFTTLGLRPFVGRLFDATDDRRGAPPVAVASYGAWQKYGLSAAAIGQTLTMNGISVTLAGVTPPAFFGDRLDSRPPDFWLPLGLEPEFTGGSSLLESTAAGWLYVIGRLRPGADPSQVQAALTTTLRRYLREPGHINRADDLKKIDAQVVRLAPGGGGINAMREEYQQGLYVLQAISIAVLLIACANLANLLLVRGAAQRGRTAVEIAMGASRARILRRHLTESVVLAIAGGAAGLVTAHYATQAIVFLAFRGAPHVPIATSPSAAILVFTVGVSLVTGMLFGAGPAWLASRSDPVDALRSSTRVVAERALPQRALVIMQAALSVALVTVAALLTESLRNIDRQAFGFEATGRLIVGIDALAAGYTQPQLAGLYARIDERMSRVPGVQSASLALHTPQQLDAIWGAQIFTEDGIGPQPAAWDRVGGRYFETIGTTIVRGRGITDTDTAAAERVAVVDEAFARRYFPDRDPIGRHFGRGDVGHAGDYTIVGIVKDAKYREAGRAVRPMFFVALTQPVAFAGEIPAKIEESSQYVNAIALRVHGDPDAIAPAVRSALAEVDPNLPPTSMTSVPELMRISTSRRTLVARLSDVFGLIALALAATGLYGVTAYRVARRTNEIGLRVALGATRRDIAALIVRGACSQTGIGLIAGIPLALAAARALQSQLFGVSPFDLRALVIALAVVAASALVAIVLPARRATAIAPMDALRAD